MVLRFFWFKEGGRAFHTGTAHGSWPVLPWGVCCYSGDWLGAASRHRLIQGTHSTRTSCPHTQPGHLPVRPPALARVHSTIRWANWCCRWKHSSCLLTTWSIRQPFTHASSCALISPNPWASTCPRTPHLLQSHLAVQGWPALLNQGHAVWLLPF